jgi:PAS domain S-box-containing protein
MARDTPGDVAKQADRDTLFDLSIDMLVVAHFGGTFDQVNPAWARTFGYTEEELLRITWRQMVHPDDQAATREAGKQLFGGQPTVRFENRLRCKDGSYRWVSWNARPVPSVQKIYAVVRDITEQKAADARQQQLQDQLREAQKLEALGTLAAGIAHDFNNIVATVVGHASLARDDVPPQHPVQARLTEITQAGRRAGELVRQLLAFGRSVVPELRPLALDTLLRATADELSATLPPGVALHLQLPAEPLAARADAAQLRHALQQLWTNACQALDGRAGRIELGLERWDPTQRLQALGAVMAPDAQRPHARLWLRDSGRGMDSQTLARVFDPFFTTRPVGQGVGLGLSAVHGIVGAHGGRVHVESLPERGTTVHLLLPLDDEDFPSSRPEPVRPMAAEAAPASTARPAEPVGPRRPHHVLYVDDDETVMLLMESLLQRQGYRVTGHNDPDAALRAVRGQPDGFDLVITDFNMPARTGLDLARDLVDIRPDLPVVILSGYVSEGVRARAAEVGVRSVVSKGGSIDELGAVLRRILADPPA